jgi:actin-related protein
MKGADLSKKKPILMGETGAARAKFSNASSAALAIKNVMIESLNYGFTGWGIWNWDTVEQITRWTLTEQNNTMNNVLSPSAWPIVGPNKTSTVTRKSLI